jgi:hypothetical protein
LLYFCWEKTEAEIIFIYKSFVCEVAITLLRGSSLTFASLFIFPCPSAFCVSRKLFFSNFQLLETFWLIRVLVDPYKNHTTCFAKCNKNFGFFFSPEFSAKKLGRDFKDFDRTWAKLGRTSDDALELREAQLQSGIQVHIPGQRTLDRFPHCWTISFRSNHRNKKKAWRVWCLRFDNLLGNVWWSEPP